MEICKTGPSKGGVRSTSTGHRPSGPTRRRKAQGRDVTTQSSWDRKAIASTTIKVIGLAAVAALMLAADVAVLTSQLPYGAKKIFHEGAAAPVVEEILVRGGIHGSIGLIQSGIRHYRGQELTQDRARFESLVRIITAVALFTLPHAFEVGSAFGIYLLLIGGRVLSVAYERKQSLTTCIALHSIYNVLATVNNWLGIAFDIGVLCALGKRVIPIPDSTYNKVPAAVRSLFERMGNSIGRATSALTMGLV